MGQIHSLNEFRVFFFGAYAITIDLIIIYNGKEKVTQN